MLDFTGQAIIVTGAGGNLGAAVAETLAGLGADLALADMREEPLRALAGRIGGVPLLIAGADVPQGAACRTPVTLLDLSATILDAVGEGDAIAAMGLPGTSLLELANAPPRDLAALSQLHTNAPDGFYMLRTLRHKYVHYVNAPPQLFDMEADPEELHDLAADPAHAATLAALAARLRAILDPDAVDAEAKAAQLVMMDRHGGEEAIRKRERMAYTPPPVAA
jgi:choline-sulfatase